MKLDMKLDIKDIIECLKLTIEKSRYAETPEEREEADKDLTDFSNILDRIFEDWGNL